MATKEEFENHCWKDIIPEEDIKTYAPYARETVVGQRPGLLVIDLYNLVYKGGPKLPHELDKDYPNSCGIYAHRAIEPTQKLIESCREASLPIFYITAQFSPHRVNSTKRRGIELTAHDCEVNDAFAPQPEDVVLRKERPSSFFGTPLIAHLNERKVDSLIVCGESTSGCVRASVLEGHMLGKHISVVEECVFDRSELIHKVNLFDMHHKYADVMHLEDVQDQLKKFNYSKVA